MICIAKKNAPFSHQPGMCFLIPHTSLGVCLFPTRLVFLNLKGHSAPAPIDLPLKGPFKDFTVQQDLGRGHLTVWGWSQEGYFRYHIKAELDHVVLVWEKAPRSDLQNRVLCSSVEMQPLSQERLSLGMHKAQEWPAIRNRLNLKELIPVWLQLARLVPQETSSVLRTGNFLLLDAVKERIAKGARAELLDSLQSFFLSAFSGVFVPRLRDDEHQGLMDVADVDERAASLPLLTESAQLIRSLFYRECGERQVSLLPCLPAAFHCGRMIHIESSLFESLDFEWTKGALRRVQFATAFDGELILQFPKGITACRKRGKESVAVSKEGRASFTVTQGQSVKLDRFLF
jgi:hypothetical protein